MDGGLIIKIANATLLRILMAYKGKGVFDEYGAIKTMIGGEYNGMALAIDYEYLDCAYVQTCPHSLGSVLPAVIELLDEYADYELDSALKAELYNNKAAIDEDYQFVEWVLYHEDGEEQTFRFESSNAQHRQAEDASLDDTPIGASLTDSSVPAEKAKQAKKKTTATDSVKKAAASHRVAVVDNAWTVEVPQGCVYSTDETVVAKDIEGNPYALLLQSEKDHDFSNPYGPEISVAIRRYPLEGCIPDLREDDGENLIGQREYNAMAQMFLGQTEEIVHTNELGVYAKELREETYEEGSVFSRSVSIYVKGATALYDGQVRYYGNDEDEADQFIMKLIRSIGLVGASKVTENTVPTEKAQKETTSDRTGKTTAAKTSAAKGKKTASKEGTKSVSYLVERDLLTAVYDDPSETVVLPTGLSGVELTLPNDSKATAVVIPEGYRYIGWCSGLCGDQVTDIYIPDSLDLRGGYVGLKKRLHVRNNPYVKEFVEKDIHRHTVVYEDWQDQFEYTAYTPKKTGDIFRIEDGVLVEYNGCDAVVNVPDGVTKIGESAFACCGSAQEIVLPQGVVEIESLAFYKCWSLKKVHLTEGITAIPKSAFFGCQSLNNVVIPEGVKKVGEAAFAHCLSLDHIELPMSVTNIGTNAFYETAFEEFPLHDKISVLGMNAFDRCFNLKKIVLPPKVKMLKWATFSGCSALETVVLNENLQEIKGLAFAGCPSLKPIELPASVTKLGELNRDKEHVALCYDNETITLRIPHDSPVLAEARSKKQYRVEVIGGEKTQASVASPKPQPPAPKPQSSAPSVPQEIIYKIRYDMNGGKGNFASQQKRQGESVHITSEIPTHDRHYEFLGWSTQYNAHRSQYCPGDVYTKDESVKLYAVWKTWVGDTYTPPNAAPASSPAKSEGCYIATAVYGSYDAPEVMTLRRFRDEVLAQSCFGRWFIRTYYRFSPPVAERLKNAGRINRFVRSILDKWVQRLNKNQ